MSPQGTKLIAVGNAHGTQPITGPTLKGSDLTKGYEEGSNPYEPHFERYCGIEMDPFRVGTVTGRVPWALPTAINFHAFSVREHSPIY